MITEQGLSISHVSQTMDIGVTAIRRWMELLNKLFGYLDGVPCLEHAFDRVGDIFLL